MHGCSAKCVTGWRFAWLRHPCCILWATQCQGQQMRVCRAWEGQIRQFQECCRLVWKRQTWLSLWVSLCWLLRILKWVCWCRRPRAGRGQLSSCQSVAQLSPAIVSGCWGTWRVCQKARPSTLWISYCRKMSHLITWKFALTVVFLRNSEPI